MARLGSDSFDALLFSWMLLLLLLLQPISADSSSRLVLPLRTQKIGSVPILRHPSKLVFRHNVSLAVTLAVGTPPQNVSMVLDTGSELSWLLCSRNHSSSAPSFNPHVTRSYFEIPCATQTCRSQSRDLPTPGTCDAAGHCHVSLSYADGSSSDGILAADLFILGDAPARRTAFGCMPSAYSSAVGDAATVGLLGMNKGALSFVTQNEIRRFAYCISDRDSSGLLLVGESPLGALPFSAPLNYTPLIQMAQPLPYFDRVAYSVQLDGIRVGSVRLPIPESVLVPDHTGAGQTMVDSGSQFTFLLGPAYEALKSEFLRQTRLLLRPLGEPDFVFQGALDLCFRVAAGSAPPPVPEVVLMFRGAEMSVAGERLLYRVAGERRGSDEVWCFTMGNSDLVPMEAYVIGHHHQQNVWVEYDLQRARVGFAPVRCDLASQKLGLVL